jgi:hypothetical protein
MAISDPNQALHKQTFGRSYEIIPGTGLVRTVVIIIGVGVTGPA